LEFEVLSFKFGRIKERYGKVGRDSRGGTAMVDPSGLNGNTMENLTGLTS
jgi:hypothetical protein